MPRFKMPAVRFLPLLLSAIFVVRAANVGAAVPAVWRPYREVVASAEPTQIAPQQYVEYVAPPVNETPVDVLTDVELDQLSVPCCGDPVSDYGFHVDSVTSYPPAGQPLDLELLPSDLIWHSYWAGAKEPRTAGLIFSESGDDQSLFDVSLGGRTAVFRNGYYKNGRPLGWELQLEGAAQLRLNLDHDFDFDSADFRFGVPLIYAPDEYFHWKFAYYHLSSHVGDEFLVRNPTFNRINYSRDVLVIGTSFYPALAWRWYAEVGWAFYDDEGSDPWEFQFGVDYAQPGPTGRGGTPFVALNGHLRQELNFGGNLVAQAGWLWRGQTGRVLRTGLHYYNGKSPQFQFFDTFEHQIGVGIWQEY